MAEVAAGAGGGAAPATGRGRWWRPVFWAPVVPLVALDLWSKAAVFGFIEARYPPPWELIRHEVWTGAVDLHLVHWHNTGTIWGLFQDFNLPLVVLRCAAVVVIVNYLGKVPRQARFVPLILGVILAGALGNLFDNFTEPKGGVRDFLSFTFHLPGWDYQFPAFNVADSCITAGVIALIASILFSPRRP